MNVAAAGGRLAVSHWPLPAACALFLLAGALALDGYGIGADEPSQRAVGNAAIDYLLGDGERAFDQLHSAHDRYYGAVFEAPLALVERILGRGDSRETYLARHLITHLFFLTGGVFCYLLVYRLFGSRALALAGMALFLLHPRIYAHSFFNSKDVPFLVAFVIALYLVHRAFRRDTLAAFLLCGVGVGLLANLRVAGIALVAAVLVLRALDLPFASGRGERRRILLTAGGFLLAATLTLLASLPVLWTDPPARYAAALEVLGSHPWTGFNLFRGEWLYARDGPPFDYLPVWVGITTPPATLLLALAGAVALAWHGARRPRDLLRNTPLRFGVLLIALPVVMAVAVVALENNVYNGWRQLYFLYAPMLLLAVFGLHGLARGRWMRAGAYALAVTALAVTAVSMVRIHPHQNSYFTALVDRTTPERLASRYEMDDVGQSAWSAFAGALARAGGDRPDGPIFATLPYASFSRWLLPPDERERLTGAHDFRSGGRNLYELRDGQPCPAPLPPGAAAVSLYASAIYCIVDPVAYFGALRREALAAEPLHRSLFDAHRVGSLMVYLRDECSPDDLDARVFLHVHPVDPSDLPRHPPGLSGWLAVLAYDWQLVGWRETLGYHQRGYGFERLDFRFWRRGVRIDGDCVAAAPLPAYPIARIHTGQHTPEAAEAARRAVAASAPLARSRFDVHLDPDARALTYVRDGCSREDIATRFFLHLVPADARVLSDRSAAHGFDNHDFELAEWGARTDDGGCAAVVPLPAWPIASVRTGQFDDAGQRWAVEFAPPEAR